MSSTVYYEPHRLPAAIMAAVVHGAFFALLYFGIAWQSQPGATMSVELWQSLPEESAAPPVAQQAAPVVAEPVQPPQQQEAPKPEIVMPDKKKKAEPPRVLPRIIEKKPPVIGKIGISDNGVSAGVAGQQAAKATREQASKASLTGSVVDEYKARIIAKIYNNTLDRTNAPDDVRAEFLVTLLPDGTVLNARMIKSSGYAAYDSMVERAIWKSQPLPLPPDAAMFNEFREMKLGFSPKEKKR